MTSKNIPAAGFRATGANRVRTSLAALAVGAVVLVACSVPSNEPTSYADQNGLSYKNFVAGCTGADPIVDGTTSTLAPSNICECQYAVFVGNVPYNDTDKTKPEYAGYQGHTFIEINNQLKRDGSKFNDTSVVPQSVKDKLNQCKTNPTSATLPANFNTGTTGPGGTERIGSTATTVGGTTPGSAAR